MSFLEKFRTNKDVGTAFSSIQFGFVSGINNLNKLPSIEIINRQLQIEDQIINNHKKSLSSEFSPPLPINPIGHGTFARLIVASICNNSNAANIFWHHEYVSHHHDYEQIEIIFCTGEESPWSTWRIDEPSRRRKVSIKFVNGIIDPNTFEEVSLIQTIPKLKTLFNCNGDSKNLSVVHYRKLGEFLLINQHNMQAITEEGQLLEIK